MQSDSRTSAIGRSRAETTDIRNGANRGRICAPGRECTRTIETKRETLKSGGDREGDRNPAREGHRPSKASATRSHGRNKKLRGGRIEFRRQYRVQRSGS